tara:strand:+ start:329 stop:739 length:411 start_codon:yes stop_codon:yes gene_type:complete
MPKSNAFKLAELIRGIQFDVDNDKIVTQKKVETKNTKREAATRTSTEAFSLDTFSKNTFRAARYIVAMSEGTDFHSTEVMLVHDGSTVTLTQYGTLKSKSLATFDADISGNDVRLRVSSASNASTSIKFDRTVVDA